MRIYGFNNVFWSMLIVGTSSSFADTSKLDSIRSFDFRKYYLSLPEYHDCPETVRVICEGRRDTDYCPSGISLSVSYPLIKDAPEIAIVNGSTCMTGTAGPDIHDIYVLKKGHVEKIDLPQVGKKYTKHLIGNRNFNLVWQDDYLIQEFYDESGLSLTVQYQWQEKQFHIISIEPAQ